MTQEHAIHLLSATAMRFVENNEETLHIRISDEMLANDDLWQSILADLADDYDRDLANETREIMQAVKTIDPTLSF